MIKKITKLAFIFVVAISSFAAISCDNFMESGDFIENLSDSVWNATHECPVAKIISPVYSATGDNRDKSIVITFTKSINPDTFENGFSIVDDKGNSLRDHYGAATWNSTATQVVIPANKMNLLEIPENSLITIQIKLNGKIKDTEKVSLNEAISETFLLNSLFDQDKPTLECAKMALTADDLNTEDKLLVPGAIEEGDTPVTKATTEILTTNHINNKVSIYAEGFDYGSSSIWANVEFKRVYDTKGNAVKEEPESQLFELTDTSTETPNISGTFDFSLEDFKYSDGIYKVDVSIKDISDNKSDTNTFFLVRDTQFNLPSDASLNTPTPGYRNIEDIEKGKLTLNKIYEINKGIQPIDYLPHEYTAIYTSDIADSYITYRGTTYGTKMQELSYTLAYGSAPYENQIIKKDIPVVLNDDWIITYPDEVKSYIDEKGKTINIYIELTATDAVGNKAVRYTYIPKQVSIYSYTLSAGDDYAILNFDDKGGMDVSNELHIKDYTVTANTRIYYAKVIPGTKDEDLVLSRNYLYEENEGFKTDIIIDPQTGKKNRYTLTQEPNNWNSTPVLDGNGTLLGYNNDPWDGYNDPPTLTHISENDKYLVIIQTIYSFNANSVWCGTSSGLPQILYINGVQDLASSPFKNATLTCTATKKLGAKNTGLTTITATPAITGADGADIKYSFATSTDGQNWVYYSVPSVNNTYSFNINTPLNPEIDSDNDTWLLDTITNKGNSGDHDLSKTITDPYTVDLYVKCIASSSNYSIESAPCTVTFTNSDDNTSPVLNTWHYSHNMTISADGTYFYNQDSPILDDAWNECSEYTLYYAPYQQEWEYNLNPLSETEIKTLTNTTEPLYHNYWGESFGDYGHGNGFEFPVNGLADGEYMLFITLKDKYGNSTTGGMGKIDIGTFKNPLSAQYKDGVISAELKLAEGEKFTNNNIFVEYFDDQQGWVKYFYGYDWAQSDPANKKIVMVQYIDTTKDNGPLAFHATNLMTENDGKLTFTTSSAKTRSGGNNFPNGLDKGYFYKLSATSWNISEYFTDPKYNKNDNTKPVFYIRPDGGFDYGWTEDTKSYDVYENETVSYPSYIYVPADGETVPEIKHTFDSSNVRIMSNYKVLVNIITSLTDLGDNTDEWERRGSTIYTTELSPDTNNMVTFDYATEATKAMFNSGKKGKRYYAITVHFADGESAVSKAFIINN